VGSDFLEAEYLPFANGFGRGSSNLPDGDKAMKNTQGWGWLAAGVLALGLNGMYLDGGAAWAHRNVDGVMARVANRAEAVIALAWGRADRFVTRASLVAARDETTSCRFATTMARLQTKMAQTKIARTQNGMARFEAMSARQEETLARVEANRARIEAQVARILAPVAFHSITSPVVACPRVRVNVNVPRVPIPEAPVVKIPAPVVEVEMKGAGPV
jgi:hypothetical protein